MIDPGEQFADLTGLLEDLHGIAVEGQRHDQPPEHLHFLAQQICNGLQRGQAICRDIVDAVGGQP